MKITKETATEFFSEVFKGEHHIPGKVRAYGNGNGHELNCPYSLSTFDDDYLTRLVLLAHDKCFRVEIMPCMRYLKIAIWKRDGRGGSLYARHPTISQAISAWRERGHMEEEAASPMIGKPGSGN